MYATATIEVCFHTTGWQGKGWVIMADDAETCDRLKRHEHEWSIEHVILAGRLPEKFCENL